MLSFVSCGKFANSTQSDVDSTSNGVMKDSITEKSASTRGDDVVFGAEANPSGTDVKGEGFGRCLESGCYCKEFKGRGQTCRNCGHAYRRHY